MKLFRKLGIDLGTTNTLIWEAGEGVVLNEPTVVAVGLEDRRVLAAGNEAKKMVGKTPEYIEVVRPLREGVIADYEVTEACLKYFLKQVMGPMWLAGPEVMVGIPAGATQVEQRAMLEATLAAGAKSAHLIDKPLAAAIGARIPVAESLGNMVVDVGGGVTEAAVIALGGVVTCRSLRTGGVRLDMAVADYLKRKHNLLVGEQTAETLKINLGGAIKPKKVETMEVSGRDAVNGLPKNLEINSDEVYEAMRPVLEGIVGVIREAMAATPPELVADIADKGVVLTGGGSQLKGFNLLVTRETGVGAQVIGDPQLCVIKGVGAVAENFEDYRQAIR